MRKRMFATAAVAGVLAASLISPAGARAPVEGEGEGMKPVANISWKSGTDMEIATIKGREIAFAMSRGPIADGGGLHVIDVTTPEKPKELAWLKCSLNQGDVQLSHDLKTVVIAADGAGGPESCLMLGKLGFMTVDVSNPAKPKPIGVAEISRGSHNITTHPRKPYVYNSHSDLAGGPEIQIWSIKNPAKPELVNTIPSVPHAPHDIAFNKDGSMAVTAAISHWDIFDTKDPENPKLLWESQCPGCSITHDAKFTPDGKGILVGDEGGGGGTYPCPGGALYFYQLHGTESQPVPVLTGVYEPDEFIGSPGPAPSGGCTSHVFEISDDATKLAIGWYTAGVRLLDIADLVGVAVGPHSAGNVRQIAYFVPKGGNTWSAKLHKGPYVFTNDINLGFIAYKVTAK